MCGTVLLTEIFSKISQLSFLPLVVLFCKTIDFNAEKDYENGGMALLKK